MNLIKVNWKYRLRESISVDTELKPLCDIDTPYIALNTSGVLKVKGGYAWDGPSGPVPDYDCLMVASLFHDALYQLLRLGILPLVPCRRMADALFRTVAIKNGCIYPIAQAMYIGLGLFGESNASSKIDADSVQS